MSSSLFYIPKPVEPEPVELPFELKKAISHFLWGTDGSVRGQRIHIFPEWQTLKGYLAALEDQGIEGAKELNEAMRKHGHLIIWIGERDDYA